MIGCSYIYCYAYLTYIILKIIKLFCPNKIYSFTDFLANIIFNFKVTVKPVLSSHSKIDKTKVLKTDGTCSLMQVESIAECSLRAFCNTFDLR